METYSQKVARIVGEELTKALAKMAGAEPATDRSWKMSTGDVVPMGKAAGMGGAGAAWTDAQLEALLDALDEGGDGRAETLLKFAGAHGFRVREDVAARAALGLPGVDEDWNARVPAAVFAGRQMQSRSLNLDLLLAGIETELETTVRLAKGAGHEETAQLAAEGRANMSAVREELAKISASPIPIGTGGYGPRPPYVDRRDELRELVKMNQDRGEHDAAAMYRQQLEVAEARAIEPSAVVRTGGTYPLDGAELENTLRRLGVPIAA